MIVGKDADQVDIDKWPIILCEGGMWALSLHRSSFLVISYEHDYHDRILTIGLFWREISFCKVRKKMKDCDKFFFRIDSIYFFSDIFYKVNMFIKKFSRWLFMKTHYNELCGLATEVRKAKQMEKICFDSDRSLKFMYIGETLKKLDLLVR